MMITGQCAGGYRFGDELGKTLLVDRWDAVEIKRGTARAVQILSTEAMPYKKEFLAAAELQRELIHPNRVQVIDIIEADGRPAIVTEQIVGPSLATWRRIRTRTPDEVIETFRDVVRGVGAAHHVGLLHLGLTTSQIWLCTRRGTFVPKVELAFGPIELAGLHLGNGRAPEHAKGERVDVRADLFLLGALLYEMLTGRPPFEHASNPKPGQAVAGTHLPIRKLREDIPDPIPEIVERLLSVSPNKRPSTTNELLATLVSIERASEGEPSDPFAPIRSTGAPVEQRVITLSPARPRVTPPPERAPLPVGRIVAGSTLAALALLSGVWWGLRGISETEGVAESIPVNIEP